MITNSIIKKVRLLAETVSLQNNSMEYQLANLLYKFYKKNEQADIILDQTSLSNYLGTSRVTIYKILQRWKANDIISIKNRKIKLLDVKKIQNILENNNSYS